MTNFFSGVRARSKNESPKPGTFPTPTMKIPSAQVNDALIDPISLEASLFLLLFEFLF
jgi:hypothetical protein